MTPENYPRTPVRVQNDSTATRRTFADLQGRLQAERLRSDLAEFGRVDRAREWIIFCNDFTRLIGQAEAMGHGEILNELLVTKKRADRIRHAEMADAAV